MTDLGKHVQNYFSRYLVSECGVSGNTIRSYQNCFRLLFLFMSKVKGIKPDRFQLNHLNRNVVLDFLDWLQETQDNTISTRNQRLAVICSFCKYLQYEEPARIAEWQNIRSIRKKKGASKTMTYLSTDGIKLLLEQIPNKSRESIRDLAMLTLLYDTGCRVQELINLKPSCVRFEYPCYIRVTGKGNKQRDIPLKERQLGFLQQYMDKYSLNRVECQERELFFNRVRGKLTTAGVTYILKKYADEARKENSSLIPKQISPHIIRHSKAMHLLQGGLNLVYIRDFLGHVSIQTTEIYARADSKQKREALESVYEDMIPNKGKVGSWEGNAKELDFLTSLGV